LNSKSTLDFAVHVGDRSRPAARCAWFSLPLLTWTVLLLAGALAGLVGGIQVSGLDHRLIEGFCSTSASKLRRLHCWVP